MGIWKKAFMISLWSLSEIFMISFSLGRIGTIRPHERLASWRLFSWRNNCYLSQLQFELTKKVLHTGELLFPISLLSVICMNCAASCVSIIYSPCSCHILKHWLYLSSPLLDDFSAAAFVVFQIDPIWANSSSKSYNCDNFIYLSFGDTKSLQVFPRSCTGACCLASRYEKVLST